MTFNVECSVHNVRGVFSKNNRPNCSEKVRAKAVPKNGRLLPPDALMSDLESNRFATLLSIYHSTDFSMKFKDVSGTPTNT